MNERIGASDKDVGLVNLGNAISLRQYLRTTQRLFFVFFIRRDWRSGVITPNLHAQGIKFTGRNPSTKTPISSKYGSKYGSCVYNECYNERMLEPTAISHAHLPSDRV